MGQFFLMNLLYTHVWLNSDLFDPSTLNHFQLLTDSHRITIFYCIKSLKIVIEWKTTHLLWQIALILFSYIVKANDMRLGFFKSTKELNVIWIRTKWLNCFRFPFLSPSVWWSCWWCDCLKTFCVMVFISVFLCLLSFLCGDVWLFWCDSSVRFNTFMPLIYSGQGINLPDILWVPWDGYRVLVFGVCCAYILFFLVWKTTNSQKPV